ncbi:molybdopterin-dependent oxidoreductase [Geovibrio ferrireducens]|uniref:molybdopterin-dependent oxidoreductase n=1 Tax=Geovibrio ferrireducens TaxID=46201 RepID=UPI0022470D03|nr:molybdopterin-dependent oxidoreductase [Geovibrio ferrireducens]
MSLKSELKTSRRSFLKWASALSATAVTYGCGGDSNPKAYTDEVIVPDENLVMDRTLKEVMGTHPHNCGGRCPFKFYVKGHGTPQARIAKLTAAGDIPRENSLEADESTSFVQTRACVRGYAQIKRTYSPDRLKYPLIQTKERGDVTGFKRVSWDKALDIVADKIADVYSRFDSGELPYIPMVAGPPNGLHNRMMFAGMAFMGFAEGAGSTLSKYLGPTILPTGAPSFENMLFAAVGSVGVLPGLAGGNSVYNYKNSDFIIQWGADPAVKEPNKTFFLTKAKEAGVPIVTVDAQYTDTASILSTGFPEYNLPQFIQVRPQTDAALSVAMAYIIYKRGWHDDTFIKSNCFGFYPTQGNPVDSDGNSFTVVAPPKHPGFVMSKLDFSFETPLTKEQHPYADEGLVGKDVHVPAGMSFVEYLDGLGVEKAHELGLDPDKKEEAVIRWASQLTGVDESTIFNLADAFAHAGDVFLENGNNGGQKTNNGMHNVWMMICLAAMCGHTVKQGGNLGVNSSDGESNPVSFPGGLTYPELGSGTTYPFIAVDANKFVDLVVTGRDGRTAEQFYNDTKSIYGVDLGSPAEAKLEVDMVLGSYHITNSFNTCPNTNKAVNIFTQKNGSGYKIKHYVIYEQYMTPTAAYADVILPACSHHEKPFFTSGQGTYYQNKLIEPMYDTKSDVDIDILLAEKLNSRGITVSYSRNGKTDEELCAEAWETASVTDIAKPTFAELKEQGVVQKEVSGNLANPMVGLMGYLPYTTETGKIQFFSPFYYYRDACDLDNQIGAPRVTPRVKYVEPYEGYDKIMAGDNIGIKGKKYPLQFTTKHARNRVHTVYDNVSMIRDQFDYPKRAIMNPADASKRGIKDGDMVYIYNDWGCLKVGVGISPTIREGVVSLPHGVWYRKGSETYEAWYDIDLGNSVDSKTDDEGTTYYKYIVNVDIGGCENTLTHDKDFGSPKDPLCGQVGDNHFNGNLCEVSINHPDY